MNVLYVPDKPEQYGAAISMRRMILLLSEMGVTPIILAHNHGILTEFAEKNKFEYHVIPFPSFYIGKSKDNKKNRIKKIIRPLMVIRYYLLDFLALNKVRKEIDLETIDIIHSNIDRNDLGAILSRKYRIPHIWHIREFGELDYGCVSLKRNYIKFMNEHTDCFVAISKAVRKYWIDKGIDKSKILTIYNGVPVNTGESLEEDEAVVKFVFAGSISEEKGQLFFLKALVKALDDIDVNKLRIDFYGNGSMEEEAKIHEYIENHELGKYVKLNGYVDDINKLFVRYDVGVVCSKAEGFGRVTAEYMMAGLCVIASNTGANQELVDNGETGVLYEYGSLNNLAGAIAFVFANKDLREKIGAEAKKKAMYNYSEHRNATEILELYNRIVYNNRGI